MPRHTPSELATKSSQSPLRWPAVRYACANSTSPPMATGPRNARRYHLLAFFVFLRCLPSHQMVAVSTPYITRCVHLSMRLTSSSGVSGIQGVRHNIHIRMISVVDSGYCRIKVVSCFMAAKLRKIERRTKETVSFLCQDRVTSTNVKAKKVVLLTFLSYF